VHTEIDADIPVYFFIFASPTFFLRNGVIDWQKKWKWKMAWTTLPNLHQTSHT